MFHIYIYIHITIKNIVNSLRFLAVLFVAAFFFFNGFQLCMFSPIFFQHPVEPRVFVVEDIIPNAQGNRITPSYVAFIDGERVIGEVAKEQAKDF